MWAEKRPPFPLCHSISIVYTETRHEKHLKILGSIGEIEEFIILFLPLPTPHGVIPKSQPKASVFF